MCPENHISNTMTVAQIQAMWGVAAGSEAAKLLPSIVWFWLTSTSSSEHLSFNSKCPGAGHLHFGCVDLSCGATNHADLSRAFDGVKKRRKDFWLKTWCVRQNPFENVWQGAEQTFLFGHTPLSPLRLRQT